MSQPEAVILNDTSARQHHGCTRVMRLLRQGLTAQGFRITATSLAHTDWTRNSDFLDALGRSNLIVINGEGTLHDGALGGQRLLSILKHPKRGNRPVALVNALWENNPQDWAASLSQCALVAVRDRNSAVELKKSGVRDVRYVPDLSLSEHVEESSRPRTGLVVGDSVRADARHALGRAAQANPSVFVPTKTLANPIFRSRLARSIVWRGYTQCWNGPVPQIRLAQSEPEYLDILQTAAGHVTGRFHGVCLSLVTGTPFLAVSSKTSKVKGLLDDSGLGTDRLLTLSDLGQHRVIDIPPFTSSEKRAVQDFLRMAAAEAQNLFVEIRRLV
jgi:polysaccharide pyruvyl transferase WcaK-like protein